MKKKVGKEVVTLRVIIMLLLLLLHGLVIDVCVCY